MAQHVGTTLKSALILGKRT